MKNFRFILCVLCVVAIHASALAKSPRKATWNFNNLNGWVYGHQDKNPNNQCEITDGILKIYTTPNSRDRKKIKTKDKIYTTGRYKWRVYIPQMGEGDQASIGAWIYCDDRHEIDFEVGYGNKEVRAKLSAEANQMVAYATTQANPFRSVPVAIQTGWHIFEIDLSLVEGNYFVQWIIDDKVVSSVQQTFGLDYKFHIFCSVENLKFIGDHIPSQENYGLYDYVSYKYHK